MLIQLLKAKIQKLVVSESSENYPGSIALPDEILQASGIRKFEQVYVNNLTNGNRIMTYAISSGRKGYVSVNGAASKLFKKGDIVHVLSFAYFTDEEADDFTPTIILTDTDNNLVQKKSYVL